MDAILREKTTNQLFDVISGYFSLFDHGYPTKDQQKAALIACDILEKERHIVDMQRTRKDILEVKS